MTSQEADFDAGLDFDCFLLTGFFEAVTLNTALRMSSSFSGFKEIGFALAILLIAKEYYQLDRIAVYPSYYSH